MIPPLMKALWDVPDSVETAITTRMGGISRPPYDTLNLGFHVGDDHQTVESNRRTLQNSLPGNPAIQWLKQIHGTKALTATSVTDEALEADALYTREVGLALTVMVADCMPVFLATGDGNEIAVAHAGWRGLVSGVLENTLSCFQADSSEVRAFLGPAIGPCHFEVGTEVRQQFMDVAVPAVLADTEAAFTAGQQDGKWMADLYRLATIRLQNSGVTDIKGAPRCTVCHAKHFYSYRRDGETGRFAAMIWKNAS